MTKRLVSQVGAGLSAGLLAFLLTTGAAHAGSKIEEGNIMNRTEQQDTFAIGALKGTATQGSIHVKNSKLKKANITNDAKMKRSFCVGVLKGTCTQGSTVIE